LSGRWVARSARVADRGSGSSSANAWRPSTGRTRSGSPGRRPPRMSDASWSPSRTISSLRRDRQGSREAVSRRVPGATPEVHRAAATEAEAEGMSLNAWVETAITAAVSERRGSTNRRRRPRRPQCVRRRGRIRDYAVAVDETRCQASLGSGQNPARVC
jgi:hypothetical protein